MSKLPAEVIEVLAGIDSFFIQQRLQLLEAVTGGCFEQPNVYDVFDKTTNKRIMIIKEESDAMSRCCCAPGHSVFVKFYLVGKDAPELKPGQKVDWSYQPSDGPFMTFERPGCDCCFSGACPKPCIGCFACSEGCMEMGTMYAGDVAGDPGDGARDSSKIIGESVQPPGGGGFKPVMQLMDRGDSEASELFAATRGPCISGGCSKLCCESVFEYAAVSPEAKDDSSKLHAATYSGFASVTKLKPSSLGQGVREMFTDSDLFDVKFDNKDITPQQKANVLAQLIHLDYMFFERDNDICVRGDDGNGAINLFNCFIYGCVCSCKCQGGGGGD